MPNFGVKAGMLCGAWQNHVFVFTHVVLSFQMAAGAGHKGWLSLLHSSAYNATDIVCIFVRGTCESITYELMNERQLPIFGTRVDVALGMG